MQGLQFVKIIYLRERERGGGRGRGRASQGDSAELSMEPDRGHDLTTLSSPPYGNQESDA